MNGLNKSSMRLLLCLSFIAFTAGACKTVASSENMVPAKFDVRFVRPQIVEVVTHGSASSWPNKPAISDKALYQAVTGAIEASGVFVAIAHDQPGENRLEVRVLSLKSSEYSVVFSSDLEMQWTLSDVETGAVLWSETISTSSKADSLIEPDFEDRHRYTIEDVAKQNIQTAIGYISRIDEFK
jgi:hypothetical protein